MFSHVLVADGGSLGFGLKIESLVDATDIVVTNSSSLGITAGTFGSSSARFLVTGNQTSGELTGPGALTNLPRAVPFPGTQTTISGSPSEPLRKP